MTLDGWLDRATRGLSADSSEQVRREIQEHYQAAREDAVSKGALDAERVAMLALGDARLANREYKKVLMTKREARLLRDTKWEANALCSRSWLKYALLAIPAFFPLVLSAVYWVGAVKLARMLLVPGVMASLLLVAPFLPIYTPARSRAFRTVKWACLFGVIWLAFGIPSLKAIEGLLPAIWIFGWMEWTRTSIRRKLPVEKWPKPLFL